MNDYEPLDLSAHHNAGVSALGQGAAYALGPQERHGLPFLIGQDAERCYLGFGAGLYEGPIRIPVGRSVRRVIVAHRMLESSATELPPVGRPVAEYRFSLAGGETVAASIRERFEVAAVPTFGGLLFRAVPDQKVRMLPREIGAFSRFGQRQMEIDYYSPETSVLWTWANPDPDRPLEAIEVAPAGPRFAIVAITLGHLDEDPFIRTGTMPVKITLTRPEDAARPFDLEVAVDRGVAGYPFALPMESSDQFLADPLRGWGEEQNPTSSPAYVAVAAIPSATLTVRQGGEVVGEARWGELVERRAIEPTSRLRVELVEEGRNWVETTIVDDATGQPVPCRVHFRSPAGVPYQPYGHHAHVNSNLDSFHADIGGDLRLGQISYAYVDGRCEGWLPRGEVLVDVARGFEYEPLRARLRIEPGQRRLELRLKRWRDMNAAGWYSGDTHVHFLSTQGGHAEARGEDLNVVNLLQSQWGHLFTNAEDFVGRPSVSDDGRTIVYASQENRQHLMGHLTLLGLKRPVLPWCTDGPGESELAGTLETTMTDWADRCHAQGGTVILPHIGTNGETPALIATGRADGAEFHRFREQMHRVYYTYLNGGYRLPLVGGTDKMYSDVPVGLFRTYVRIPPEEGFSYESWCRNLARGATFHSGGPLLTFSVDGAEIGDTVRLPSGGTVEVEATTDSIFPIHTLQVVEKGEVVAETNEPHGARSLRLRARLRVDGHTWLAARAGGPGYFEATAHRDVWQRGVFAHTSPIYVACGGDWWLHSAATTQYMLTLIDGALTYIRETSRQYPAGRAVHHHGEDDHRAFLERPFQEARAAIHRRLHERGIAH